MRVIISTLATISSLSYSVAMSAPAGAVDAPVPLLAQGTVSSHGAPAPGADLVAIAWPSQSELQKLSKGDIVATLPIAATKTTADGRFSLRIDPDTLPLAYRGSDGRTDIQLIAADSTSELEWNFTAFHNGDAASAARGATWSTNAPGKVSGVTELTMDLATADVQDSSHPASELRDQNDQRLAGASLARSQRGLLRPRNRDVDDALYRLRAADGNVAMSPAVLPQDICQNTVGSTYSGLSEYFLKAYAWSGALATVSQSYGVDHTLGIGVRSNSSGAWSTSGTSTISLNASGSRGGVADATVYNRVNYRDYSNTCWASTQRKPIGVYSLLSSFTYAPHVTWSACTIYTGGTYTKTAGTNSTYGSGVNLGPIGVSAQSGFNSESKIAWTVTARTKLCGSSSLGWVSSGQAEAHLG